MSFFSTRLEPGTLRNIYHFRIGKHRGKTLTEAFDQQPRYFRWLLQEAELAPGDVFVLTRFLREELSARGLSVPTTDNPFDKSGFDALWGCVWDHRDDSHSHAGETMRWGGAK